ncbi:hypothetical protein BCR33DRAFT_782418 [Rhizoclosmatium globosum]|uniref:DUF300-domain-containing protein n=1 Tax=Rhizoclosmatium globosum TaxID=329046 RepID=A0A1Y2CP59_9FUNG|nr:hypothetical protein BCR33DRAFT_782418 [Rhizoclosmatium globosum]|eukprot:ORY48736.1 hypothetical protein BCR33DRAFT_782418 [Rhizoclosmatium globosum]
MTTSNSTSTSNDDSFINLVRQVNRIEVLTAICVALIQVLLLGMVTSLEYRFYKTFKRVINPINVYLLLVILFHSLYLIVYYQADYGAELRSVLGLYYSSVVLTILFEISLMLYSWNRGYPVITAVVPKWLLFWIRGYICVYIVIQISFGSCVIAQLAMLALYNGPSEIESKINYVANLLDQVFVALLIAFDAFTLFCYIRYVTSLKKLGTDAALVRKLTILSRFGIFSCLWIVGWQLFTFVPYYIYQFGGTLPNITLLSLSTVFELAPFLYTFVQILMKWVLYLNRESVEGTARSCESGAKDSNVSGRKASDRKTSDPQKTGMPLRLSDTDAKTSTTNNATIGRFTNNLKE